MLIYIYDWTYIVVDVVTYYIGFGITTAGDRVCYINSTHMKKFYVLSRSLRKHVSTPQLLLTKLKGKSSCRTIYSKLLRKAYEKHEQFHIYAIHSYNEFKEVVQWMKDHKIQIYEDDIDPLTEFLNAQHLDRTGWMEIRNYQVCEPGCLTYLKEYYCCNGDARMSDHEEIPSMRILSMDTETFSTEEHKVPLAHQPNDEIRLIGTVLRDGHNLHKVSFMVSDTPIQVPDIIVHIYPDQISMIRGYIKYLKQIQPEIIIGYNHLSYDYQFIVDRYIMTIHNDVSYSRLRNHILKPRRVTWSSSAYQNNDFWIIDAPGVIDIDVMQFAIKEQGYKGYSLNKVSKQVLGESKLDMDYLTLQRHFATNNLEGLIDVVAYCIQDCELPIRIFEKKIMQVGILERAKVERVSANDLYVMGSAARTIGLLHYECTGQYILDTSKDVRVPYQGSTVLQPRTGIHNHCATVDFTSLYPSIIISENICYTTYVPEHKRIPNVEYNFVDLNDCKVSFVKNPMGVVPKLLIKLLERRKEAKARMKTCSRDLVDVWDKRQWAYKIVANSIYGLMGSSDPYLMFPLGAACVTGQGRNHLNTTINILQKYHNAHVIYGDTDSCFITLSGVTRPEDYPALCVKICDDVSERMHGKVKLEFENAFVKILILAKKSYIALRSNGTYYYRGVEMVKKNRSNALRQIYSAFIDCVFKEGVEQAKLFLEKSMRNILEGKMSIDDLKIGLMVNENVVNKQHQVLLKHMDSEGIFTKPNERIYYVYAVCSGPGNLSHTAYRRDSRWVEKHKVQVNYRAHIVHEMKNPLVKLCTAVGIPYVENLTYLE